MKKILILLTALLLGLINNESIAQDARFAQSYANPLRINPAMMGTSRDIKFGLNYRSQWSAIEKGYKTFSFTAMYPIILKNQNGKFDIGLTAMNDKAGAFSTSDFALALDYSKEISPNNNLCLSLMGGYVQQSVDIAKLTFDSQYLAGAFNATNPTNESSVNSSVTHPDLGFGFLWFFNPNRSESKVNAYLGFSGYHLNQPNQSLVGGQGRLPMRFSYQAGLKIFGQNKVDLSPAVRVNNQNGNIEPAAGLYINYHFNEQFDFVIGGWYRVHDANAIVIGFEHANFTFGYSYDMINSGLNDAKNSVKAHELTLSIKISRGPKGKINPDEIEKEILKDTKVYSNPIMSF